MTTFTAVYTWHQLLAMLAGGVFLGATVAMIPVWLIAHSLGVRRGHDRAVRSLRPRPVGPSPALYRVGSQPGEWERLAAAADIPQEGR